VFKGGFKESGGLSLSCLAPQSEGSIRRFFEGVHLSNEGSSPATKVYTQTILLFTPLLKITLDPFLADLTTYA
jgi:hypothetical protein